MSEAKTSLVINGRDNTAGAFASVQSRAAACGARLRGVFGAAMAAAGAYMGFRGISNGISELGHLSDIAQKSNMSVDELTKTSTALDVLGIQNVGVDQLAKSMDYMQKTTGRTGLKGFLQTIDELSKIEDTAKRGQEAVKIFGRSGMEFMPLIVGASQNGIIYLQRVIDATPGISHAAAQAGDNAADAMSLATAGIKSTFLDAIGSICRIWDSNFSGGAQAAALSFVAHIEYGIKKAWRILVAFGSNAGIIFQTMTSDWGSTFEALGYGFVGVFKGIGEFMKGLLNTSFEDWKNGRFYGDAPERFAKAMDEAQMKIDERGLFDHTALTSLFDTDTSDLDRILNEKLAKARDYKSNADKAVGQTDGNGSGIGSENKNKSSAKTLPKVTNRLMMAGSNEAQKLAILGPTLQTETKKQTELLKQIAKNTEKGDEKEADLIGTVGVN